MEKRNDKTSGLASRVKNQFDSRTCALGSKLYWQGQVEILDGAWDEIHALVSGSSPGEVDLRYDGVELRVDCDCSYFEANGRCQHIWAAILAADGDGRYMSIGGGPVVVVEEEGLARDELDDFIDDFRLSPPRRLAMTKKPSWRKQLEDLRINVPASTPEPWPSTRETLYVIDVFSIHQTGN